MLLKKLNLTRYLLLTTTVLGVFWFILRPSGIELWCYLGLMLSAVINHLLLIIGVSLLVTSDYTSVEGKGAKIFGCFVGKTVIMALALYVAVQYLGERLMIGAGLYIFQLIILSLSIKKEQ